VFVLAYQQILERGEHPTQERLEQECRVQNDYLQEVSQTPDLTQEEYQAYRRLEPLPYTYVLDKDFQSMGELLQACCSVKRRPPLKTITRLARGDDLVALVEQLEPLGAEVAKLKELKQKKADLEKEKRDRVKDLMEQIHQVDTEIAKVEGEDEDEATTPATPDATENISASAPDRGLHGPSLVDLEADAKTFMEHVTTRLELAASHADLLRELKDDLPALLTRISAALDTIRHSLEQKWDTEFEPPSVETVEE
jgi:hypothetical protein